MKLKEMTIDIEAGDENPPTRESLQYAIDTWIADARKVAITVARERGSVTSDDVWERCPIPPAIDRRTMGSVFKSGDTFKHIGFVKSRRRVNHGRPVSRWALAEGAPA